MQDYTTNYLRAGGTAAFSEYYTAQYDRAIFRPALKEQVVFAQHNLVTDGSFNEFHVVMCRNVLIYFNTALQERVHDLLFNSLGTFGVLGLGDRESIKLSPHEACFEALDPNQHLYRRVR
jgi:chemotaxis protein methyltransferase CheR